MYLYELIFKLESMDSDRIIINGFGKPHSDRGYYDDLAFDPVEETTIGAMLNFAIYALGRTFTGYKGGEFTMNEYARVKIGYGDCAGEEITSFNFRYWERLKK